jgi:pyrimidine-nucleoside phosphorylase
MFKHKSKKIAEGVKNLVLDVKIGSGSFMKSYDKAKYDMQIKSDQEGFISSMNSQRIGLAEMLSGAGRAKKEDTIDYSAGIVFYKKTNDYVKKGETIAKVLYNNSKNIDKAAVIIKDSYTISKNENENKNENIKLIKGIFYEQRK